MKRLKEFLLGESLLVPVVAVLLGLLAGALIMLMGSYNPLQAYSSLFQKSFGDLYSIGETIRQITPLIFTGLAVAFAFRTGLFNIGAEGQFIVGMVAAAYIGIQVHLPWYLHAPLAVIVAGLAGGLWGAIAGYLKAARGVHEVICTIMLNWIALFMANYIIKALLLQKGQVRTHFTDKSSWLTFQALSDFFDHARIHLGILIALLSAVIFYIILWKTKQGYELRAVGLNPTAAEYAGINVKSNIVKAMFISGFFGGLGGAGEVLGVFHYMAISSGFPGYGFLGIAAALIGRNTALGTVLAAVLLGTLTYGAPGMKFGAGVPDELVNVVIAMVIFFVAASGIVKYILAPLLKRKKEAA